MDFVVRYGGDMVQKKPVSPMWEVQSGDTNGGYTKEGISKKDSQEENQQEAWTKTGLRIKT